MDHYKVASLIEGRHLREEFAHPEGTFTVSCWLHGENKMPTSILVIETGSARISFDATPEQLRAIGLMLVTQAGQVEDMNRMFANGAPSLAAIWDAIPAAEREVFTKAFAAGFTEQMQS